MPSDGMNGESSSGTTESVTADLTLGLQQLEQELARLGGVQAVRVLGDRNGRPIEVHVLSDHSKPPKQTVRDVRAVAQTVFGIELDHRIVSVAHFDAQESDQPSHHLLALRAQPRVRLASLRIESDTVRTKVQIVLSDGDREHAGYAEGSAAAVARPQLVASAALDALRQVEPAADAIHLAAADVTRIGKMRVALVTVIYVEPPIELPVSGSAVVRRDRDDAVARAVLDATNRRMTRSDPGQSAR